MIKTIRSLLYAISLCSMLAAAPVWAETGTTSAGDQTTGNNGVSSSGTTTINTGSFSYISGQKGFDSTTSTTGYGSTSLFGTYNSNDAPTANYAANTNPNTNANRAKGDANNMGTRVTQSGVSVGQTIDNPNRVLPYMADTDNNRDWDWGWLGLLGLIGLAGRGRRRHKV